MNVHERDTDTALHVVEMQADRPLPPELLRELRALALRLGVDPAVLVHR